LSWKNLLLKFGILAFKICHKVFYFDWKNVGMLPIGEKTLKTTIW